MALHRSSVVVSGWMFPRYTVRLRLWPPARLWRASGENGMYGDSGDANGLPLAEMGDSAADCATSDWAAAA